MKKNKPKERKKRKASDKSTERKTERTPLKEQSGGKKVKAKMENINFEEQSENKWEK
jgi:hypothetical protein